MSAEQNNRRGRPRRCVKATALSISLVLSALLTAMAVSSNSCSWLAWFSLLPLFLAIRKLKPATAMLAGAIWGMCFYLFSAAGVDPAISPTLQSLALLTIVPAFYAFCGALLTRRFGFNPVLLAFGWMAVEFALKPVGLQQGLLAGTQSASSALYGISRMLGYVFVAFLVAGVNATLLSIPGIARVKFPSRNILRVSPCSELYHISQTLLYFRLITIFQGHPRAPPLSSCVST